MRTAPVRWSALALAAGVSLAACASGTNDDDDNAGGEGSGVEFDAAADVSGDLEIMGFGLGDDVAQVRYDAAAAGIEPVEINLPEGSLDVQQFLSAIASGEPPDLIYAARDQIGTFASRGALMPLDACIEGEEIDSSVYREEALDQVSFEGSVYGIPEFNSVQLTMANSSLLDAAGLTVEDVNGSDWDAISAANEAMHVADGGQLSVIGYDSKLPEFFPLWVRANGSNVISDDGRTAQLDTPEAIEALEWGISIYEAQGGFGAVKAYRDSADFFGAGNQFATNVLGAMPMEQWYLNVLNEVSPDAPLTFDTFRDREGEPLAFGGGSAWAIPADSSNPQAACRFAKIMTQTETWLQAAEARATAREAEGLVFTGILTGNTEADEQIRDQYVVETGSPVWDQAIEAMYGANEAAFSLPASPADAEFKAAWEDAANRVLNGQQEVAEALAQAQEEAQAALDEAWATWDEDEG